MDGWMDYQINYKLTNPILPLKSLPPFSLFVISMTDVQFNYMHECFERVFCELKWRKEVSIHQAALLQTINLSLNLICTFFVFFTGGRGGYRQRQQELQQRRYVWQGKALPASVRSTIQWLPAFVCRTLDCCFCCRIFSSCWDTEGMEAPRKGNCHLLTGSCCQQFSSVRPSSSPPATCSY